MTLKVAILSFGQIFSFAFPHNPQIQRKAWGLNCLSMLMDQQRCVESQSRFGALSGLIRHEPEIEKVTSS